MIHRQVLIVKNITREGPGLLADVLDQLGIEYQLVDLELGEALPSITDYSALVVLGGPDSANDRSTKIIAELDYIRDALAKGIPYLGICLGLQLLVKAAGGKVLSNTVPEIGFKDHLGEPYTIELSALGQADPLFKRLENSLPVFQLHGETVQPTESMQVLGIGQHCHNQIVKVGSNAYGLQCHFELSQELFDLWCEEDADLLKMDRVELQKDFLAISEKYTSTGKILMQNFLSLC